MRAQFVRGIDPKDSMNIGNKHAREAQKLVAAFKEIDPNLDPKMTDDKTTESFEMVVASIKVPSISKEITLALAWVNAGWEYYLASWGPGKNTDGGQETYPKLEQAKQKIKEVLKKEI